MKGNHICRLFCIFAGYFARKVENAEMHLKLHVHWIWCFNDCGQLGHPQSKLVDPLWPTTDTALVGKFIVCQCKPSVIWIFLLKYCDTSSVLSSQLKEDKKNKHQKREKIDLSYSPVNVPQNQIKSVDNQCTERCDMKCLFLSASRLWNGRNFATHQYQSIAIGNRWQSIKGHTDMLHPLVIDCQYQSINWYRLLSIYVNCHRLDTTGAKLAKQKDSNTYKAYLQTTR